MKKEIIDVEEVNEVEEESKEEGLWYQTKKFAKKHGKKIATGAALTAVGFVGFALGKMTKGNSDEDYEEDFEEVNEDNDDSEESYEVDVVEE